MLFYFIQLELKRFYNVLSELGIFRALAILGFLFVFVWGMFKLIFFVPKPTIVASTLFLTIASLHFGRKDKRFLKLCGIHRFFLYVVEYSMLLLPFIIAMFLGGLWEYATILIMSTLLLATMNKTLPRLKMKVLPLNFVHPFAFEWKQGLRKQFLYIFIFSALSLVFAQHLVSLIIGIFLIAFVITTFYYFCESRIVLHAFEYSKSKFLQRKLLIAFALFLLLISPQIILALIIHTENAFFMLAAVFVALIHIGCSIVLKYALYSPGESLKNNSIIISILAACYTYPFLMPIPAVFLIIYYRKAIRKLNAYLYAYH